ncbi:hypothetical protein RHABOEDO_000674 [Candidatus Rhabdochlamydia oedothoracis]|uniref:Uncharacterized protein n=1 Tax=Candidatus Rhabdochlamydia oedothoracis TaxID=2720720 RepID=A0ABX8V013_9BACT|nr:MULTISPECIES: hypothetical protein [Rhabdochlamydia]KAG6558570.1 hypothetical protein RHOW815_001440 [Candidatus Rhabdochlamydia sp. W815]QYF48501.1 hypothetical protein RHABOEDO_000674 [Candidatus Rhabdochlamydia oedothoracis]
MTITKKCILSSHALFTKNPQERILNEQESSLNFNQIEAEVDKILKDPHPFIYFSPLARFINEGDAKFEALLNKAEKKQIPNSVKESLPRRKIKYHLRYQPYRFFQEETDSSEQKKQQILDLIHSGIAKAVIEKEYGICTRTLKEWCKLSPWSGWKITSQKR